MVLWLLLSLQGPPYRAHRVLPWQRLREGARPGASVQAIGLRSGSAGARLARLSAGFRLGFALISAWILLGFGLIWLLAFIYYDFDWIWFDLA